MSTFSFTLKQQKASRSWPLSGWTVLVIAIAAMVGTPILFVLSSIFTNASEIWNHLAATVLSQYISNSLLLMFGVGIGVFLIGTGTAWLVTMCRFPGGRWFEWLLLLPLAAPAYLLAYIYTELLEFYGPIQTTLRYLFGWENQNDYWFPEIRSLWGAIVMLVIVLYPYVYLLARVAFLEQCTCTLEASRSLGCNPWRSFFKVALPLARPSLAAGIALALMETLNDFGTVDYFGVQTFTTGIYRTWLGMGERTAATQLAALLLFFVLSVIILEKRSRQQAKYYQTSSHYQSNQKHTLQGFRSLIAFSACALPVTLGFLLPVGLLLQMTIHNVNKTINPNFWKFAYHSFTLAILTALLGVIIALILAYSQRLNTNLGINWSVRIAAMGYAIPGSVIAIGILVPLGQFDNLLDHLLKTNLGISSGLLLSGTITALIFAYLVRFLAIAFDTIASSLSKIKPHLDEAARSLGRTPTKTLTQVHIPLMGGGILTAAMLVFVDVMKELPATLVIRPFNFDTLAVRVYQYASDERLTEAAAPALAIILVGLLPVILLSWKITHSHHLQKNPT